MLRNTEIKRFETVIVNSLLLKPVGDDHDFKATGERRYKHSDGSLWAPLGCAYQVTICVNEGGMTRLYDLLRQIIHTGERDFKHGYGVV